MTPAVVIGRAARPRSPNPPQAQSPSFGITFAIPQRNGTYAELLIDQEFHAKGYKTMLRWAIAFFVLALIAGVMGFGGLEGQLASIAKILVFVFLVLFVVSLIFGRSTTPAV
jgi:uncharacterized membrane protein YtjA (UPF0391 family)